MTLLCSLALAAEPHFSYPELVTANGHGAVVYSGDRLADGFPHLYQEYRPGEVTPEVLYDSYFGVVKDGVGTWLTGVAGLSYAPGTNVITVDRGALDGVSVTEHAFAPMSLAGFGLAQIVVLRNDGTEPTGPFQVVSLHNWHLGGTESAGSASATDLWESGATLGLSFATVDSTDAVCVGAWETVNAGGELGGGCAATGDDLVPAFGWRVDDLQPGEERWFGVVTAEGDAAGWIGGREPVAWYTDELADWAGWQAGLTAPAGASADEEAVYRQGLAFLRMAQVREEGDAFGQIAASLPLSAPVGDFQHIWNITWVRDGSYAAAALAAAGEAEAAADSLAFMIQPGKTGEYRSYVGEADYAVSVCRVYGDGTEWSDADQDGPNVEFDNFGLYLWALGRVVEAGGEERLAEELPRALDGVSDVLVRLIDPNTGLLLPDSSIWERHWNGNQQQFTYSSAWAVAGLRAAADLADRVGDTRGDTYRDAASRIAEAIPAELLDANGVVAASREQLLAGDDYYDLAAVEVFNHEILAPGGPEHLASLAAWERELAVASGHGFMRNDDGSTYDLHEWVVMDLRLAESLFRACEAEPAQALVDWVTAQARLNQDTIPELMNPDTADYAGPAPMLGFGAGAYAWVLLHREEWAAACETPPEEYVPLDPGCSCGGGGAGVSGMATLLSLSLLRRRRS